MKELSYWKHADNYFVYFHNTILKSLAIFSLKSQIDLVTYSSGNRAHNIEHLWKTNRAHENKSKEKIWD